MTRFNFGARTFIQDQYFGLVSYVITKSFPNLKIKSYSKMTQVGHITALYKTNISDLYRNNKILSKR